MMRFIKTWITELKSDIKYYWDQKTASRSNRETWTADWKESKERIILNWKKSIFLNRQHINEDKKQEIEQQKHKIIHDC